MSTKRKHIPKVVLMIKPVDGGRAVIGVIDCPNCGQEHLTTNISCGERKIFCGSSEDDDDGYSWVDIQEII